MATQAYRDWVSKGRHYTVAQPVKEFVEYARAAGIGWLGTLGSDDARHLQADKPQDHTPFSTTQWPVKFYDYVVTACDLERGAWCETFLRECKLGLHPWVKYVNFDGHHYDVRHNWDREASSDDHFHVSCRSDHLRYTLPRNPFTGENMELTDRNKQPLFVAVQDVDSIDVPAFWDGKDDRTALTVGQQLAFAQQDARYARVLAEQNRDTLAEIKAMIGRLDGHASETSAAQVKEALRDGTWKISEA